MTDWVMISSLVTGGGTLVLALATFSSVRSANRTARVAERSLLAGLRPVLIPSREEDLVDRIRFGDGQSLTLSGHGAAIEVANGNIYLGMGLRNGGAGLAVIHGWRAEAAEADWRPPARGRSDASAPAIEGFRRQQRDLYVPAGDVGFWQGAIRDSEDASYDGLHDATQSGARVFVDLLYSDHEGGQRTIARFGITPSKEGDGLRAEVLRYWSLDGENPR